ncbi:LCP family protein [Pyramidobacter porci]
MRRGSIILTVLIALAAFAVGATYRLYSLVTADVGEIKKTINFDERHGTVNVLVLGVDEVEAVHRSDTIILARIDIDRKTASIMSIPRDTRVSIKGRKQPQKLNHAYAFGGIELLRDTVINLTGVPVNYYLVLNYASFPKIVDAIGGVDIDVPRRMQYTDRAQNLHIDFAPGRRHMNGADGLKYVRFRHDSLGDIGRMKRQQEFAKAFLDKVKSPAILPRIPELIELVLAEIKTDIPVKTALQLAGQLKDMKLSNVRFFTMPGSTAYIDGLSYFVADLQRASQEMDPNSVLSADKDAKDRADPKDTDKPPAPKADAPAGGLPGDLSGIVSRFREPIAILNGTGTPGLGKQVTTLFERAGIAVAFTGNAKHADFRYCLVQYPEKGDPDLAKDLARLCGISEGLVRKANITYPAALVLGKNNSKDVMARIEALLAKRQ